MVWLGGQGIFRMCSRTPAIVTTDTHLFIIEIDGYSLSLWRFVNVFGFFKVLHREGPGTDVDCGHTDSDKAYNYLRLSKPST